MVSEGGRPWGEGRSGDCEKTPAAQLLRAIFKEIPSFSLSGDRLDVPSMEPQCETKQVEIGENRSGLPGKNIGQNKSELVKTGSKLGQIGNWAKCPLEHQDSKGRSLEIAVIFLTKTSSMVGRLRG